MSRKNRSPEEKARRAKIRELPQIAQAVTWAAESFETVSYTHLDVYKRQDMSRKNRSPEEKARRAKIRELLQMANIDSMDAVSYTHLDVYKRQI